MMSTQLALEVQSFYTPPKNLDTNDMDLDTNDTNLDTNDTTLYNIHPSMKHFNQHGCENQLIILLITLNTFLNTN